MHMYDVKTDTWSAAPPQYQVIQSNSQESNLSKYMKITEADVLNRSRRSFESKPLGAVYSLQKIRARFGLEPAEEFSGSTAS